MLLPVVCCFYYICGMSFLFFLLSEPRFHVRLFPSGWMFGERLHDGERGWFPSRVVEKIMSAEIRAQNLKECQRIQQAQEGAQGSRAASRGRRPAKSPQYTPTWTDL